MGDINIFDLGDISDLPENLKKSSSGRWISESEGFAKECINFDSASQRSKIMSLFDIRNELDAYEIVLGLYRKYRCVIKLDSIRSLLCYYFKKGYLQKKNTNHDVIVYTKIGGAFTVDSNDNTFELYDINEDQSEISDIIFSLKRREIPLKILALFNVKERLTTDEIVVGLHRKYKLKFERKKISSVIHNLLVSKRIKKTSIGRPAIYERIC